MTVNFNVLIFAFMLQSLAFLILRTQYGGYSLLLIQNVRNYIYVNEIIKLIIHYLITMTINP